MVYLVVLIQLTAEGKVCTILRVAHDGRKTKRGKRRAGMRVFIVQRQLTLRHTHTYVRTYVPGRCACCLGACGESFFFLEARTALL